MSDPVPAAPVPRLVGPYRIVRPLGEGGTAFVYLAEQLRPFRRMVALKVLKSRVISEDAASRFEQELQTLARLHHENVAQVFDYSARGRETPYFTIEYVEGHSIADFCDHHRLGVRERVAHFLKVCDAVQYVHQNGVIHRDIKASNVLVQEDGDRSVVKLIDFGVAKLSREHRHTGVPVTDQGRILGTLGYMSPEQASDGQIDIRADVYSMGALLYELLTGTLPFERPAAIRDMPEFLSRLRNQRPELASLRIARVGGEFAPKCGTTQAALSRQVRAELEWILAKALEKERENRYPTVADFARDLRAYLRGDPVSAGPPSAAYHLRRGVRRHLKYVAAALGTILMLAFAAALSAFWQLRLDAEHERQIRFLRLGEAVQVAAANAHLWLEEALAGDDDVDFTRDVVAPIEASSRIVQAALHGGSSPVGQFDAIDDEGLAAHLRSLGERLEAFVGVSRSRWIQRAERGSAGTELDRKCDEIYRGILEDSVSISVTASRRPADSQRRLNRTVLLVNVLAVVVSSALLVGVGRSWVRRQRNIA